MKKFLLLLLLSLPLVLGDSRSRVLGGSETRNKDVQWLVKVDVDGKFRCLANFLTNKHVLSLASCYLDLGQGSIQRGRVQLNEAYLDFENGHFAVSIAKHEKYSQAVFAYDLAILGLSLINPEFLVGVALRLPDVDETYGSAKTATLATIATGISEIQKTAYTANLTLHPLSRCQEVYGSALVDDSFICGGDLRANTCLGDAAAPLYTNGTFYGITSFGSTNCGDGNPTAFIRISDQHVLAFIYRIAIFPDANEN